MGQIILVAWYFNEPNLKEPKEDKSITPKSLCQYQHIIFIKMKLLFFLTRDKTFIPRDKIYHLNLHYLIENKAWNGKITNIIFSSQLNTNKCMMIKALLFEIDKE